MLLARPVRALVAMLLVLTLAGCSLLTITPPTPTPENVEEDDDFGTVAVYSVDAQGSLDPSPDHEARRVWEMFEQVATPIYAGATILTYRVGDSADSDTLAYVYRDQRHPALWNLAANLAYADDRDLLLSTLIHEYGHLLSLNDREVPPGHADTCTTLDLYEGCANDTSAIYAFQAEFWDPYGDDAPDPSSSDDDIGFYQKHDEDFVSQYAATSVTEDFAETFMTFVLEDRPDPASTLAAKFAFFYDRPDYVVIRDRIRAEFGL